MRQNVSRVAVVDHGWRHQPQTRVMVLVVVLLKKRLAKSSGVFDGAETIRNPGRYFKVRNWLSE
jgi:hypothetical protein